MADSNPMASQRSLTSSAMVGLKAELHRKQEEFRRQKVDHGLNVKGRKAEKIKTKKNIWSQQNRGVSERSSRDLEEKAEEEDDLVKSRRMLAHKSRLYDEMASTSIIPDDDGSEGFLVDFQRKVVNRIVDEREKERKGKEEKEEEEAERKALAEPVPEPVDSDEEWVDFTDSLGRSRRCMKRDLAKMKKKDQDLVGKVKPNNDPGKVQESGDLPELMSSDMHRERMRKKWEEEEQVLLDKGQEDIHYSNVQHDEIRSHGVGFYQFSKDHEAREEQLDQLKKLRDQTLSETSRKDKVQAKRKALMEARLAKVRDRRKLKDVSVAEDKSEEKKAKEEAVLAAKKLEEEQERKKKEEVEKEAEEVRRDHIREWDKDKQKNSWAGKGYVESRRNERETEFAPPSFYSGKSNNSSNTPLTGVSDEERTYRLKQFTQKRGINPDFAPPACYDNKNINIAHRKQQQKLCTSSTLNSAVHYSKEKSVLSGNEMKSQKSVNTCDHPDSKSSESDDSSFVGVESIPLPSSSSSSDSGGNLFKAGRLTSTSSAVTRTEGKKNEEVYNNQSYSFQHSQMETQQGWNSSSSGNNWYYHQQQQHQHQQQQQQQQQQQHYHHQQQQHHQQQFNNPPNPHLQHQPTNDGSWMTTAYQQQHPPPQQDQYYQQQIQPLPQPAPPLPQQSLLTQPPAQNPLPPSQQDQYYPHQTSQTQLPRQPPPQPPLQQQPSKRHATTTSNNSKQNNSSASKPKVPKTAILDTRFLLNDTNDPSSTDDIIANVEAVPYEPGSFTAARYPNRVPSKDVYDDSETNTTTATQIAGGPQLYSKKQREEQQKQLDEENETGDGNENDQKLNDFLASIRSETS